jgi:hypothetical protein
VVGVASGGVQCRQSSLGFGLRRPALGQKPVVFPPQLLNARLGCLCSTLCSGQFARELDPVRLNFMCSVGHDVLKPT